MPIPCVALGSQVYSSGPSPSVPVAVPPVIRAVAGPRRYRQSPVTYWTGGGVTADISGVGAGLGQFPRAEVGGSLIVDHLISPLFQY